MLDTFYVALLLNSSIHVFADMNPSSNTDSMLLSLLEEIDPYAIYQLLASDCEFTATVKKAMKTRPFDRKYHVYLLLEYIKTTDFDLDDALQKSHQLFALERWKMYKGTS